jgi:hypothetical protein
MFRGEQLSRPAWVLSLEADVAKFCQGIKDGQAKLKTAAR